jgi:hypothetical protein
VSDGPEASFEGFVPIEAASSPSTLIQQEDAEGEDYNVVHSPLARVPLICWDGVSDAAEASFGGFVPVEAASSASTLIQQEDADEEDQDTDSVFAELSPPVEGMNWFEGFVPRLETIFETSAEHYFLDFTADEPETLHTTIEENPENFYIEDEVYFPSGDIESTESPGDTSTGAPEEDGNDGDSTQLSRRLRSHGPADPHPHVMDQPLEYRH